MRSFRIPDAGKTTLTESCWLRPARSSRRARCKARGDRAPHRSDWMEIEQQRGISITSSVMTFEQRGSSCSTCSIRRATRTFREDTYRTLTAVDCAIMVIDAAKGIEAQTLKLFEVCRLRDIPIITFVNKVDREGLSPLDLIDEIAGKLALDVTPADLADRAGRRFPWHLRPARIAAAGRRPSDGVAPGRSIDAAGSTIRRSPRPFRRRGRQPARDGGLALAAYPAVRSRDLPRRPSDPGDLRLGAQRLRGRATARRSATGARRRGRSRPAARRSSPTSRGSPASCSRCRPTWTPTTATASPSCASARASSSAA